MTRAPIIAPRPSWAASEEEKIEWCIRNIIEIGDALRSNVADQAADAWTITNLTEDRIIDCDATTLAEVADNLGTLINDLGKRGQKRYTS